MKPLVKGLIVAVVHLLLVSSLGAKLLYDRATRPRVWVRAASYDPDHWLRGRYLSLQVEPELRGDLRNADSERIPVTLSVVEGRLLAMHAPDSRDLFANVLRPELPRPSERAGIEELAPVTTTFAAHLGIEGGLYLHEIARDSVAERAGLREGDVLVRLDGFALKARSALDNLLEDRAGGEPVTLTVLRDHREIRIRLPVARPETPEQSIPSVRLRANIYFFVPEGTPDPLLREEGEELWVEVTIPRKGPPRPVRLGVRKEGSEDITPLDLD